MEKKSSTTNMYELLSVNNQKPKQEPVQPPAPQKIQSLDTLSGFLNAPNLSADFSQKTKNTPKIIKGDFYKDPELISKNCELSQPETPVLYTEAEVVFNDSQKYKGILVITEYRLIFEFFDKDKGYEIGGFIVSEHGDAGISGAFGSPNAFNKTFENCIVGHTHSPEIREKTIYVGTLSKLIVNYNQKGMTKWVHANAIIHKNETAQLILI